jgi:membrane-associated phospholipid phosphatase
MPAAGHRTGRSAALLATPAVLLLLFALLGRLAHGHGGAPLGPDGAVHDWMTDHRPGALTSVALLVTATGTGALPYAAALIAGWTGCPRPAPIRQEVWAAAGGVATLLTGQGVRIAVMTAVARPRPPVTDWLATATGSSFPSGHTTTSALAAGLLGWSAVRSRAPRHVVVICLAACACWAGAVGLTRVYLGVHWPTDVLGGWLLAAGWLTLALPLLSGLVAAVGRATDGAPPAPDDARRTG